MIQKITITLSLIFFLSLLWFASGFLNAKAAPGISIKDKYAVMLSPQSETVQNSGVQFDQPLTHQASVTQTGNIYVFIPIVVNRYCSLPFNYNETIRYNLTKIEAEDAWANCSQGEGITVAVVDTGIDLDHPDLQANLVSGKSFVSGTSSPDDDAGHGTHVAGAVAAVANNGGVIGVAPKASLMPIKVLDSSGSGSIYDVVDGIEWATDNGANVINMSLGSVSNSSLLQDAIDYAHNRDVLIVAAGGNCGDSFYFLNGCNYQDQPVYPGADGDVMAVASTDSNDNQSSFSNEGSYIEIAAPGSSIYSTYPSGSYATLSGTSMASPHVAGLAALIWSQNPDWSNEEVRAQMRNTADDLGSSGWDSRFGYGRINAASAMGVQQTTSTPNFNTTAIEINTDTDEEAPYIPGEIIVKLKDDVAINNVIEPTQLEKYEVKVAGTIEKLGVVKLTLTPGEEQTVINQLLKSSGVAYAELNYIVTIH